MGLNHNVWLPKLKFTLQTIAVMYPQKPNTVTKKKYYEFIQNLPIFIPIAPIGKNFIKLLDEFPVTPYLDKRKDFIKWVHFIFNKINKQLNEPKEDLYESLEKYYEEYKPKEIKEKENILMKHKYLSFGLSLILIYSIYYFYYK